MIDEELTGRITQMFPSPLADAYDYYIGELGSAISGEGDAWKNAVIAQRELIDITFAFMAVIVVCDYLYTEYGDEDFRRNWDQELKKLLRRPSTGSWCKLITELPRTARTALKSVVVPEFLEIAMDGKLQSILARLNSYRNNIAHDVLPYDVAEIRKMAESYHNDLESLYRTLDFMSLYSLGIVDSSADKECRLRVLTGLGRPKTRVICPPSPVKTGELIFLNTDASRTLDLHPLIRLCEECRPKLDILFYRGEKDEKRLEYFSRCHSEPVLLPGSLDILRKPRLNLIFDRPKVTIVDEPVRIECRLKNTGNDKAHKVVARLKYPSTVQLPDIEPQWVGEIEPYGGTIAQTFTLLATIEGKYQIEFEPIYYQDGSGNEYELSRNLGLELNIEAPTPPEVKVELSIFPSGAGTPPQTDLRHIAIERGSSFRLRVKLTNLGNTVAEDVCFEFAFPEGIEYCQEANRNRFSWLGQLSGYGEESIEADLTVKSEGEFSFGSAKLSYNDKDGNATVHEISTGLSLTARIDFEVDLVDRVSEIRDFEQHLTEVLQGRGRLICLAGEAGIGKTRLTKEFARIARPQRVRVLKGQCTDSKYSYELFVSMLEEIFKIIPGDSSTAVLEKISKEANALHLSDEIRAFVADFLAASSLPSASKTYIDTDRVRRTDISMVFERIINLFYQLQRRNPLLIFLEDLHWVDTASLELLKALINRMRITPARILLCGTYRPEEKEHHKDLCAMLAYISRYTEHCSELDLDRFSQTDSYELIDRMLFGLSFQEKQTIYYRSEGIPFIVQQILRLLYSEGKVEKSDIGWHIKPDVDLQEELPKKVRDLLLRRISSEILSDDSRKVLECASVMALGGKEFCAEVLEKVLARNIDAELDLCVKEGLISLLEERSDVDYWYEFSHNMLKDIVYKQIGRRQRDRLHRSIGEELERHFPEQLEAMCEALSEHFSRGRDFEGALAYSIQAGRKAKSSYAFPAACTYYESAIKLRRRLGLEQLAHKEQMAQLLLECAELKEILGKWDDGLADLGAALKLSAEVKNDDLAAWVKLNMGRILFNKGKWKECLPYYRESLELFEKLEDYKGIANTNCRIGTVLKKQGMWNQALEHYQRDLEISQMLDDRLGICRAYQNIGSVLELKSQWDEAMAYYKKADELAVSSQLRHDIAKTNENIGSVYQKKDEWDIALSYYEKARNCYESLGDRSRMANAISLIGDIYYLKSGNATDLDLVFDHYKRTLDIYEELGDMDGIARTNYDLGCLYRFQDRYVDALEFANSSKDIRETLEDREGLADTYRLIGDIYFFAPKNKLDLQKALDYYKQALVIYESLDDRLGIAGASLDIGWLHNNYNNYDEGLKYAETASTIYQGLGDKCDTASVFRVIGDILRKRANSSAELDNALEYYQRALDLYQEIGEPFGVAGANFDIGWFYMERCDWRRALKYAKDALITYKSLEDRLSMSDVLRVLGYIYEKKSRNKDELEHAIEHYQKSLKLAKEVEDLDALADTNNDMGGLYESLGEFERALEHYGNAYTIWNELDDKYGLGLVYTNLASVRIRMEDYSQTPANLQTAERFLTEVGNWYALVKVYKVRGELLIQQNELEAAEATCREGLDLAANVDRKELIPEFHGIMGQIHLCRQDYESAKASFDAGVNIAEELGLKMAAAQLNQGFTELYIACGEKHKAKEIYSQVINFYQSMGASNLVFGVQKRFESLL